MPKFFCCSETPQTKAVPSGSRVKKRYMRSSDLRGKAILEEVGEIDLQDHINSFRDEVNIDRIVSRAANGDLSVLQRVQGTYADISGMPTNVHELNKLIKRSEEAFNKLPDELKAGKSFDEYLSDINSYNGLVEFAQKTVEAAADQISKNVRKTEVKADAQA